MRHSSIYFYGNKVSEYGIQHKRVDYRTLAKCFDAVLSNDLISKTAEIGYWEQVSGGVDYSEIEDLQEQIEELEEKQSDFEDDSPEYEELEEQIDSLKEQVEELEEYDPDIYQYYIISENGVEILEEAKEIVFYNEELDLYVWGVTHCGTSWDYVLTDIVLDI